MSLISGWYSTTLAKDTDDQNTPEVDLQSPFEAIEIDIPTLSVAAEIQIKGSNSSGGTFDLIGYEEPVPSSTGGFRVTVPLGGRYRYIKVYLSVAQTSDAVFAVRGISYASGGLVVLLDRIKALGLYVDGLEADSSAIKTAIQGIQAVIGAVGVNADVDGLLLAQLRYIGEAFASLYTGPPASVTFASDDTAGGANLFAAAAKLYWLVFTKETAGVGFCKIYDGTSGSSGDLTIYCPAETSLPMTFNPPWQFDTGIRNAGMSAGSELVIGYVAD